jgi:hypothetical protein
MLCSAVSLYYAMRSIELEPLLLHPDTAASTPSAAAGHSAGDADMQSQQHGDTANFSGTVDGSVLHRRRRHQQAQINNATIKLFYHSLKGDLQAIAHHVSSLHHHVPKPACMMQISSLQHTC